MVNDTTITIIIILSVWIFLGAVLPVLSMPNYKIIKTEIQSTPEIKRLTNKLKKKSKQETLKNMYNFVINRYSKDSWVTKRMKLFFLYPRLFFYDLTKQLSKKQFLACHQQTNMLRTLLLNTNQFKEEDIKRKNILEPSLIAHQYLIIKTNTGTYKVDPFFLVLKKLN